MKKLSLFLAVLLIALSFSSCQKDSPVVQDNILSEFKEDNTFSFYYRDKISALTEADTYKVYYLSYDLNKDGINEDFTYLSINGDTSKIQLDIHDTTTGKNIAPRESFNLKNIKIQILKAKTQGYNNLKYLTSNSKGKVIKTEEMIYSKDYYTEK